MRPCTSAVRCDASLADAALAMLEAHSREIPVTDEEGNLAGVVRADDLFSTGEDTVRPIIRPARMVVAPGESPLNVAVIMQKVGVSQAIVVDGKKLAGLFTLQQALERLAD